MRRLVPFTVLLLSVQIFLAKSIKEEDLTELLDHVTCERQCRDQYLRSCSNTPPHCGPCVQHHIDRDGVCYNVYADVRSPDGEIDEIARHHQRKEAHATAENDDYNSGGQGPKADVTTTVKHTTTATHHKNDEVYVASTSLNAGIFIAVVVGCSIAGVVGLIVAGVCWYRLQKNVKAASEVDYPAYGVTGPANGKSTERLGSPGDRKLAQSAQMYHYQHQKQQMIAMEKAHSDLHKDGSDVDSEEENEEGDYTVFECPGLAPTGEMEVKNPLFSEDTPVTPSVGETRSEHK